MAKSFIPKRKRKLELLTNGYLRIHFKSYVYETSLNKVVASYLQTMRFWTLSVESSIYTKKNCYYILIKCTGNTLKEILTNRKLTTKQQTELNEILQPHFNNCDHICAVFVNQTHKTLAGCVEVCTHYKIKPIFISDIWLHHIMHMFNDIDFMNSNNKILSSENGKCLVTLLGQLVILKGYHSTMALKAKKKSINWNGILINYGLDLGDDFFIAPYCERIKFEKKFNIEATSQHVEPFVQYLKSVQAEEKKLFR
eukprot:310693_1